MFVILAKLGNTLDCEKCVLFVYTHTQTNTHTNTNTNKHTQKHTQTNTHTYKQTHTQTKNTQTHTHKQTNTHTLKCNPFLIAEFCNYNLTRQVTYLNVTSRRFHVTIFVL